MAVYGFIWALSSLGFVFWNNFVFIFLYGEDTFRSRQKLNQLITEYKIKHKSGLNFVRLADFNLDKLKMAVAVSPMFQEKKLIILENIFQQKVDIEILDYLKQNNLEDDKEIILIIWEGGKIDAKNELFGRLAKKPNLFEEFAPLSGLKLLNWIKKEIEARGGKIEGEALKKIAGFAGPPATLGVALRVGSDLWLLDNEINKLIAYRNGQEIIVADVDLFVKGKIASNIFNTVDALGELNKKRAMALIQKHLDEGEDEFYLLSMLVYQFRNLVIVKNSKQIAGMHPFVLKKSLAQAKNFTYEQLKNIYERLLKIDVSAKTGKVDARLAIEVLIAEI